MDFEKSDKHTAGALDIRNVIGSLLAIYGVILLVMGVFGDKELDKTGDINANLYAGRSGWLAAAAALGFNLHVKMGASSIGRPHFFDSWQPVDSTSMLSCYSSESCFLLIRSDEV